MYNIDYINKFIVCFAGYVFPLKYQYREEKVKKTSFGTIHLPDKIKSFYSNSEACKNCFYKVSKLISFYNSIN